MRWQTDRTPFFKEEQRAIRKAFPDVEMLESAGLIFLRGDFPVHDNNGNELARYRLEIIFPSNYPDKIPVVKAVDTRIKPIADRHVFRDRTACLCLPHEISLHLPEINFINFWEKLLNFWLIGQACYDRDGKRPDFRPANRIPAGILLRQVDQPFLNIRGKQPESNDPGNHTAIRTGQTGQFAVAVNKPFAE